MEEKVVKLGVVGLGRGFGIFCGGLGNKNVKLHAICDKNPALVEKAKARLDEEKITDYLVFDDFEDLIKSDIDAVIIATEAVCHVPFVVKALDAGKHVLSEIPAIDSVAEIEILRKAVYSHPELKYMAGENCFYWAFIQAWKTMFEEGKFGDVVYAEAEYLHPGDVTKYVPGTLDPNHWRQHIPSIKYLTHDLGPLLYIMDDYCTSVTCMEPDVKYNPDKFGAENGVALFKTAKGAVIKVFVGFGAYMTPGHHFRLHGTRGSIETDRVRRPAHSFANFSDIPGTFHDKIEIPVTQAFAGESKEGHGGADPKMIKDFIKCIVEDTKPPIDVEMGIRISLPGILAHESAVKGGMPVEIPKI